uniref:Metallophos domain-containing protein n=2 Tax=Bursaphelenchus xylophilus TaxID=6326 RepID=A0A1I7S748_BURXY
MSTGVEICKTIKFTLIIVALIFTFRFILNRISFYYLSGITGYEYGNAKRMFSIFQLVSLMANLSWVIYLHMFSFFNPPFTLVSFKSRTELKRAKRKCLYLFLFVMTGSHMAYVFYLFPYIPWPLFELFNIFCGLWMHLFFCSVMFYYSNYVFNILKLFNWGKVYSGRLWRCDLLHLFINDHQFQVVVTITFTVVLCFVQWVSSDKLTVHKTSFQLNHPLNDSIRVLVLSDLHSGASVYTDQIASVVDRVNELDPDLIFLVGDTVDAPVEQIKDRVEPLRHLRSRLGTFLVTGNHEYYYGNWGDWVVHFGEMGINVLQNGIVVVGSTCFVGLNDISSNKSGISNHFMDLKAISECKSDHNIVVLEHNPAAAPKIVNASREYNRTVDLIVSGHTHAGQFYVLVPYVYWALPFWYGVYDVGPSKLLVSAGTLYQTAPMKMLGMSQIWVLTLK